MAGKFEITKAKDGDYHFHLKAANGQIILTSQMYKEKSSARGGIEAVKKNAPVDKPLRAQRSPQRRAHVQPEGWESSGHRNQPDVQVHRRPGRGHRLS